MARKFGQIWPGRRFGKLTVIAECVEVKSSSRATRDYSKYYFCQCECGDAVSVHASKLNRGETRSCGCLSSETTTTRNFQHGHNKRGTRTKVYNAWCHMRQRCYNEKNKSYADYGGRGIRVCDRWIDSFENFLADMGEPPSAGHSIDRIDHEGHYEPGNCRWAAKVVQANNKRNNRLIYFAGEIKTLATWAREKGIEAETIGERLRRGWSIEKALSAPTRKRGSHHAAS
jgi:hypothetical protein